MYLSHLCLTLFTDVFSLCTVYTLVVANFSSCALGLSFFPSLFVLMCGAVLQEMFRAALGDEGDGWISEEN